MDTEQRLEDLENSVSYLLTQVEGKSKLVNLIDVLHKENEEVSKQRSKLLSENIALKEALSAEKALTNKLHLICSSDEKNSILLRNLDAISDLLGEVEIKVNGLIVKFKIDN